MKMTLLELVQDILNDMDSDSVNSITDTPEAMQVAQIVKTTYYNIINNQRIPQLEGLMQLDPIGTSNPTSMRLPSSVLRIDWVKYNCTRDGDSRIYYQDITYLTPKEFLDLTDQRVSTNSNVVEISDVIDSTFFILNDTYPTYWTSFDDDYLVFDSYDADVENNLQNSKCKCFGLVEPSWNTVDSFTPDLPPTFFPYLLEESKSSAAIKIRQLPDSKAEMWSNKHRRNLAQSAYLTKEEITYPNYGRK